MNVTFLSEKLFDDEQSYIISDIFMKFEHENVSTNNFLILCFHYLTVMEEIGQHVTYCLFGFIDKAKIVLVPTVTMSRVTWMGQFLKFFRSTMWRVLKNVLSSRNSILWIIYNFVHFYELSLSIAVL